MPRHGNQFMPQQFNHQQRPFYRGRGRGPRLPCDICGRLNHTTNYCYYKPQPPRDFSNYQWRGIAGSVPQSPWTYQTVNVPPQFSRGQGQFQMNQARIGNPHAFAGFTEAYTMPYMPPPIANSTGFTEAYAVPYMVPSSSVPSQSIPQPWYFDSGATNHVTNNLQHLNQTQSANMGNGVLVGNGSHLQVT